METKELENRYKELNKEIDRLQEQLTEQIDYKDEYYHYWQQVKEENEILKKALELACEEIDRNQGSLSDVAFDYFIEKAKESIK